ncbi:hypothetical protein GRAQ_01189 [Rahnella aquatilis CIP 78.65 = ATCC 33071]|nr:hypothetical protein GRAQ_01189 [Rahnella aquatilis CIP 78.65 = ATCC 33071]
MQGLAELHIFHEFIALPFPVEKSSQTIKLIYLFETLTKYI